MSRGRVVETLTGRRCRRSRASSPPLLAPRRITTQRECAARPASANAGGLKHFVQTDNAPAVPLALVTVLLALFVFGQNSNYLSSFNISNMLLLATALGFIALGQTVAVLSAGIDLSVGPLAGFLVVVASFFMNDGQSAAIDRWPASP